MSPAVFFYVFGALALAFSLMVVLLRNPISSALSLVASFFCVSAIFVLSHATFLGVIQVLIYAGAILVLFLYVLMLLNLQDESWVFRHAWTWRSGLQALSVVVVLGYVLLRSIVLPSPEPAAVAEGFGTVRPIGEMLLGEHALAFEWVSVVLFAGILGVIALTPRKESE